MCTGRCESQQARGNRRAYSAPGIQWLHIPEQAPGRRVLSCPTPSIPLQILSTVVRRSRMHCRRRAAGMELHGQPTGFGEIGTGSFITQPQAYCQALSNPATPATRQGGSGSRVGHVGPRRLKFPSLEPGAWPGCQEVAACYCPRYGHSRSPPNKFCLVGAD
jgi:hypothetical protein